MARRVLLVTFFAISCAASFALVHCNPDGTTPDEDIIDDVVPGESTLPSSVSLDY